MRDNSKGEDEGREGGEEQRRRPIDFNRIIWLTLRYGSPSRSQSSLSGQRYFFAQGSTAYYPIGSDVAQLFDRHNRFLIGFVPLVQGLAAGKPCSILSLGLIVLPATPIAKLFVSVFLFFQERRLVFVCITVTVLAILLVATFGLGPLLAV
jgi:uncharacterized membrane protein